MQGIDTVNPNCTGDLLDQRLQYVLTLWGFFQLEDQRLKRRKNLNLRSHLNGLRIEETGLYRYHKICFSPCHSQQTVYKSEETGLYGYHRMCFSLCHSQQTVYKLDRYIHVPVCCSYSENQVMFHVLQNLTLLLVTKISMKQNFFLNI